MKRIQRTELIVLKSEKSGENHRLVTIFTENTGVIRALAFGATGSKSKMRATTTAFCLADGELYYDPVKDLWRITHLYGKNLYDGIRENLKKFYSVSFIAEIILKSYSGGDERVYQLFSKTVKMIDLSPIERDVEILLVLYLWRYLWMNGVLPDLSECSSCGRDLNRNESIFYKGDDHFVCSNCRTESRVELNHEVLKYLSITSVLKYEDAMAIDISDSSLKNLKNCLILIVQAFVEYPLKTLKSSKGFL
ncbi:MAG: DNA repair protein RecO [Spirochaetaceae bacterium]|jgi:DNA repair protein RecO (recombination protein O)|nr:DNA repair protein RecO [Spirochaetaceae bacterium]